MKLSKLMLISLVLLTILSIGAVSAASNDDALSAGNSADTLSAVSFDKSIYVSDTGSDSGSGSQASPYATLNKAISEVNSSDVAVIYVGPGTFTGENNTNLQINLAHNNYNGSLTIIGDSKGKTIFDGDDEAPIIKAISADSLVTLINITFTHGKLDMGSAIRSSGTLTIDGCVFTENEATNLATVYQDKANNLTIVNSKFLNNKANQMADLYYSQNALITLVNNVFEGAKTTSSYSYSPSCSIQTGKSIIKGNTFKDLSGSYYAGALHASYNNGDNIANITDNTFINCTYTGTNGGVMFFQNAYLKNNNFVNCSSNTALLYSNTDFNSFVTFEDANITGTSFNLKAKVTDDMGNLVKNAKVVFELDGKNVGSASTGNDGVATANVKKLLDNGKYTISGTQTYSTENVFDVTVVNGTATVDFDHSPAEIWVSPNGDDANGDGSQSNPFLTLKHALDVGTASTVDLTVHVMNGLYNGTLNRALSYSNVGKVTIIGESYGNVVIDAEHAKSGWSGAGIFTFGQYMEATLINLTFINCDGNPVSAYTLNMEDNVVLNSGTIRVQSGGDGAVIDNLKVINGTTQAINAYNLVLTNSLFENCNGQTSTGLLWIASNNGNVMYLENNTFRGNTIAGYSGGAAYYAQGDLVSINNTFESNTVTGTTSNIAYASGNNIVSIGDKFIDNDVPSYIAQYRSSGSNPTEIVVENVTFINNRASGNGAGLVTTGAKIKGAKFINNTASGNGGAIYLLNHGKTSQVCEISLEDVTFENNTADSGNDIFIAPGAGNNVFANLTDLTITANDLNVTELSDILTVTVSHPSGAIIGGGQVTFYFDGNVIGKSSLINGNATLEYVGFENNTVYNFSAVYEYATENDTYVNGTVRTNITSALDSIELYVSDSLGSDENGTGTKDKPFKSISKALSEGYTKSTNITVHVLEGNYSGTLNTNLRIPTTVDVTIKGEGLNKTVVSDIEADYFITALAGNKKLTLADMTLNRAARDTQSAIYVEEGANVEIDNVEFLNGQGNYGGAINTAGTLVIKNSYFNGNGYADRAKRANAYYGGAIYNDGVLIIDNTTFEADHAGRLSEISTQGTLYMYNSRIIDSINAYSMNMDLVAIGAFGGQKGNITIENTLFMVTNRTVDELSDRVYDPARSLTCLAIGSCQQATIINCTFVDEGAKFSPYVFGGINSWNLASGGYTMVPGDVNVYNSTFRNVQAVSVFYSRTDGTSFHSQRVFDGCLFDNVEYLIAGLNNGNFSIAIHNSVISSDDIAKIGIASGKTLEMDISDNWWMSNNATYKNATIGTTNYISNSVLKLREISSEIVNPENYLIVTLNATNKTGLLQDVTLAFKSFDGENVSDYEGILVPRDFTISAVNGTLAQENGTFDGAIDIPFEGIENSGYYVEATVDNQTVNLTVEDKLYIGNATIFAEDITFPYGETQINVTVMEDNGKLIPEGTITLKVNNETYTADIIDSKATFDIDVLPKGNYTLDYSMNMEKVYHPVSNSSSLTVTPFEPEISANASDIVVGEVAIITVTLNNDTTGTVTVNNVTGEVINGTAVVTIPDLAVGNYTLDVIYSGDDKYANASTTVSFEVSKISDFELNASVSDFIILGNDVIIDVSGIPANATGTVSVNIGGEDYESNVSNGTATITIPDLDNGDYEVDVIYSGDDKYTNASTTVSFEVSNIVTNDTFERFFDEDGNLKAGVKCDDLIFDGVISNKSTNKINIDRSINLLGENATLENIAINVTADNVTVLGFTINAEDMEYAINVENASDVEIIDTALNVSGKVGENAYAIIADTADNLIIVGNEIVYEGDGNGTATTNAVRVSNSDSVVVADNEFDITVPSCSVSWAEIPPGSGNWVKSPISEGLVFSNCDDLELSDNIIELDYNSVIGSYDTIYAVDIADSDNVNVESNYIEANGHSYIYGLLVSGENFTVANNDIVSVSDSYYANGIDIEGPATGVVQGNNIDVSSPVSAYPIYSAMSNGNVEVEHIENNITANAIVVYGMSLGGAKETVIGNNFVLEGNYTMAIGSKAAQLDVKNNTIIASGSNVGSPSIWDSIKYETTGIKAIAGNVNAENNNITTTGDYALNLTTDGNVNVVNNYLVASQLTGDASVNYVSENATVENNTPTMYKAVISADDIVMYYKNGTRYVVKLTDVNGNPLANQTVNITINGEVYKRTTNANGTASIAINLDAGNYTFAASYVGTGNYTNASIENSVTVLTTIYGDDVVKMFRNGTQYYATFLDGQGKPLASGTEVTFNINGVMYTRKTNENGTAKLNINLEQGTYVLTAMAPNGEMHANNITVLSTIESSDLVKYYKNESQYVVTIYGEDGKAVGAGENVTFNINGVFYTRTTNATGQAKLNINLNPGTYIITAEYNGCRVANNITVLPVLTANNLTKKYGTPDQFVATLVDGQGNPYDGQNITFNINGVFYIRHTNSTGQAALNIRLMPGEYIITSMYSNGATIANIVKVEA